jgi:hypothetical protein
MRKDAKYFKSDGPEVSPIPDFLLFKYPKIPIQNKKKPLKTKLF